MTKLGKAITIIKKFQLDTEQVYAELEAFHAPSECYPLVERGLSRRFRIVRRHACHVAGVKNLAQLRRAIKQACPTWDRYNHYRLGINAL